MSWKCPENIPAMCWKLLGNNRNVFEFPGLEMSSTFPGTFLKMYWKCPEMKTTRASVLKLYTCPEIRPWCYALIARLLRF